MQKRNPLFVAGFPYITIMVGYVVILTLTSGGEDSEIPNSALFPILGASLIMLIGAAYTIYWYVTTAKVLRSETSEKIPSAFLIVIPFANYWWMWRYSKAVESYTGGKVQSALSFVLLVLLGAIGMGVLQDYYNKHGHSKVNSSD